MGKRLEPLEKKAAKGRQAAGQKSGGRGKKKLGGKLPPSIEPKSRDSVGRAVGLSGKTYERAKAGGLLKAMAERGERATAKDGRPKKVSHDAILSLSDLGILPDQSSRWQSGEGLGEAFRCGTVRRVVPGSPLKMAFLCESRVFGALIIEPATIRQSRTKVAGSY